MKKRWGCYREKQYGSSLKTNKSHLVHARFTPEELKSKNPSRYLPTDAASTIHCGQTEAVQAFTSNEWIPQTLVLIPRGCFQPHRENDAAWGPHGKRKRHMTPLHENMKRPKDLIQCPKRTPRVVKLEIRKKKAKG